METTLAKEIEKSKKDTALMESLNKALSKFEQAGCRVIVRGHYPSSFSIAISKKSKWETS